MNDVVLGLEGQYIANLLSISCSLLSATVAVVA